MSQSQPETLKAMPTARSAILDRIKARGAATLQELADELEHTREAVRQQVRILMDQGWLVRERLPSEGRGRPEHRYTLSEAGDHLFPKHYDRMSLALVDTLAEELGEEGLKRMLAALTDRQVDEWRDRLAGRPLPERLKQLQGIYYEDDPWTEVDRDERGWVLVERNCPFLNLAQRRPKLCSVTVSTLSRLLGVEVRREARFQDGDRRCVFRVLADRPLPEGFRFAFEDEAEPTG